MRLLVCGSRSFQDATLVEEVLTGIYTVWSVGWQTAELQPFHLIHGAAKGADTLADHWATNSPMHGPVFHGEAPSVEAMWKMQAPPVVTHATPADWRGPCDPSFCRPNCRRWNGHHEYCRAAGPRRNRKMLAEFEPTRLVAFVDKPLEQSRGTFDMVNIFEEATDTAAQVITCEPLP